MILAKNIHKFYDNNHILKGIDININKGEIISLVGASGQVKQLFYKSLELLIAMIKMESSSLLLNNHDVSIMSNDELADLEIKKSDLFFNFINYFQNLLLLKIFVFLHS